MKIRRDTLLLAGLIVLLGVITAAAAIFQTRRSQNPPLSSTSNAADGALAIRLWLSEAGFRLVNSPRDRYAIPTGTGVVLILEPTFEFSDDEWKTLDTWVRQGGTLLLAGSRWNYIFSGNPFGLTADNTTAKEYDLFPAAPIFRNPALLQPAHLSIDRVLHYSGSDGVTLLSIAAGPVAWQIQRGKGEVLVVANASFLSNAGLKAGGNTELALNLFSQFPSNSGVLLDEWHHGDQVNNPNGYGLLAWLTQTPAGFAALFAALIIFMALVLAGRPFGQRVPLMKSQARRGTLEYVNAVANLNRRAGHRRAVMQHYYAELKRAMGKRYRLDPNLPDGDFVAQVVQINPALDSTEFADLLLRLSRKNYSESQMVQLARDCAGWMEKIEH